MVRMITRSKLGLIIGSVIAALVAMPQLALADGGGTEPFTTTYRIAFTNTWASSTHPTSFPGNAHWSPLVGGVHNANVTFWEPGGLASPGIKSMAETGGTSILRNEVTASPDALSDLVGARLPASGGDDPVLLGQATQIPAVTVTQNFSLLTVVTMVAPSPDWFAGVHGESLQSGDGGWLANKAVTVYPYDAGTDSGTTYTAPNSVTTPPQPITSLQGVSPFSNEAVGTFTFTRVNFSDLALSKSVAPLANVAPQSSLTYTLVLSNSGDTTAAGVVLTDTLPLSTTFAGWLNQPSEAKANAGVITWSGDVPTGTLVTLTYVVTYTGPAQGQTITNTAQFAHSSAQGSQTGQASAVFSVQSTIDPPHPDPGTMFKLYLPLLLK
ncbi:MAG: spondin domain-containing protein [Anaerolineae bacterium]|nr:spondin domain-containing protein [Anaerolineae bacterium]